MVSLACDARGLVFVFDNKFKETSLLFDLLKTKRLDPLIEKYSFKTLKQGTALELVVNKDVILDGNYIYNLIERLCGYVKV